MTPLTNFVQRTHVESKDHIQKIYGIGLGILSGKIINMEVLFCEVLTFLLFSAIQRLNMSPLVDIIIKIDNHSQTQV